MIKIKLSEFMGKHKIKQKQLSEITGIRPNTIAAYYYETVQRIDINHLNALCRAFCCKPGDLLEYIDDDLVILAEDETNMEEIIPKCRT